MAELAAVTPAVVRETVGSVALLRLNRPGHGNVLNADLSDDLARHTGNGRRRAVQPELADEPETVEC